jgi:hypothetical protein
MCACMWEVVPTQYTLSNTQPVEVRGVHNWITHTISSYLLITH